MTGPVLYLAAMVLWVAGVIAWGIYFAWDTDDIGTLALLGAAFLPITVFVAAIIGLGFTCRAGLDRLNRAVQRRRAIHAEIDRVIDEVLR
jgi:hypothetical protein